MIHRLRESADFQRVLAAPAQSRSAHFALHHLALAPLPLRVWVAGGAARSVAEGAVKGFDQVVIPALATDLSTGAVPTEAWPVDDLPTAHWLGYVIPKRHAKRAVTRNLLKRQIRSLFSLHAAALPAGQWLVRLKAPFLVTLFPSARSTALTVAARAEIDTLLTRAHGAASVPFAAKKKDPGMQPWQATP